MLPEFEGISNLGDLTVRKGTTLIASMKIRLSRYTLTKMVQDIIQDQTYVKIWLYTVKFKGSVATGDGLSERTTSAFS